MYVGVQGERTGIDGTGEKYADAAKRNSEIEENIGLSLAKSANLTKIATKITEKSKVKSYGELDGTGKDKIGSEVDKFGGARAYKERWGTLGASVFAVMNEIEKDSATKSYYSKVQEGNTENPYFGDPGEKKPEFDEPLASLKWDDIPTNIKTELTTDPTSNTGPFSKLPASTYDELDFKSKLTLLKKFRYDGGTAHNPATTLLAQAATVGINMDIIRKVSEHPDDDAQRRNGIDEIREAMKTANDNQKRRLRALLDIVVDRHTSGDNTNLVQRKGDDGVKDQWIEDTVKAGKPIISGPSGHTLRYLNFWAEKRNDEKAREKGNITDWPSLEAARLVMMANLMPARHHSYDEIMTASIGIKDEASDALKYKHKSSYLDLATHEKADAKNIALNAYAKSGAGKVKTDKNIDEKLEGDNKEKEQEHIESAIKKLMEVCDTHHFSATTQKTIKDAIEALDTEKNNV